MQVDCSIGETATSKVYIKATAFLISIFVRGPAELC